ncbi:hypothetical protein [Nostoc phage N1]|nr:hypothetical protein [Nostoc phage N1]
MDNQKVSEELEKLKNLRKDIDSFPGTLVQKAAIKRGLDMAIFWMEVISK